MPGTLDLVDIISNRRRKGYLHEALALACQEMTGCDDVEPDVARGARLAAEAETLVRAEDLSLCLDF